MSALNFLPTIETFCLFPMQMASGLQVRALFGFLWYSSASELLVFLMKIELSPLVSPFTYDLGHCFLLTPL